MGPICDKESAKVHSFSRAEPEPLIKYPIFLAIYMQLTLQVIGHYEYRVGKSAQHSVVKE